MSFQTCTNYSLVRQDMKNEKTNEIIRAFFEDLQAKLANVEARAARIEQMQRSTLNILNRVPFDRGKGAEK